MGLTASTPPAFPVLFLAEQRTNYSVEVRLTTRLSPRWVWDDAHLARIPRLGIFHVKVLMQAFAAPNPQANRSVPRKEERTQERRTPPSTTPSIPRRKTICKWLAGWGPRNPRSCLGVQVPALRKFPQEEREREREKDKVGNGTLTMDPVSLLLGRNMSCTH